ncbi:MAG: FAD-dependent oxidoreductase [Lautropia sp.]
MQARAIAHDSPLWTALDIGGMRVRHRVMTTGHTLLYGIDGVLSQRHIDYYRERAAGGVAVIVTEQQAAHPSGANYLQGCRAYDPRSVRAYRALSDAVHPHDTRVMAQLFCGGAQGSGTMYIDEWRPLWAPSSIASTQFHEQPSVMTEDDIRSVTRGFVSSAQHAREGGLDGVEIHAAHSQLLGSFLSPAFNRRTDGYGGDLARRCRIVIEIGEAVRRATGNGFVIGLRLSVDERLAFGAGITEEAFMSQLERFHASGLFDFYDLSAGGYFAKHVATPPMTTDLDEGFLAAAGRQAKAIVESRSRVLMVGRVLDIAGAARLVESGAADMVAMTRAHMADPQIVQKSQAGRAREVTRCIGANVCIRRLGENNAVACVMNPALGREARLGHGTLSPAAVKKRVAVVGAGPAGLRFAGTAAERGHSVVLLEAAREPGGRLRSLCRLPGRARWRDGIESLVGRADRSGVEFRRGVRGERTVLASIGADEVVMATGARYAITGYSAYRPERESIPIADHACVIGIDVALERLDAGESLGERIVIVDDGSEELVAGFAELAASSGAQVDVVTPRSWWGEALARTYDLPHVMPRLRAAGVRVHAQRFVERIESGEVEVYDLWSPTQRSRITADTVVFALDREPREPEWQGLAARRIGDCLAPRSIEAVIFEGEQAARLT